MVDSEDLLKKAQRSLRARELGKKNYARADRLLQEIATDIEPGQIIKIGEKNGLQLKDKFFEKNIVWTPCAARRWELEEVEL